jgi:hypothetical protein
VAFWRRNRGKQADAVVIGQQMADAADAEKRHQRKSSGVPSPLEGVEYDGSAGALDMHRWVDSPVDDTVAGFASAYARLGPEEAAQARAALRMDDFYTLFGFARRSALASLRGRTEPALGEGLAAVSAIELERVDWRDAVVVGELLAWAMARAGLDHATELRRLEPQQDDAMKQALRPIAERPAGELSPGMWRCVPTRAGPALVGNHFGRWEPTVDLVDVAIGLQEVLEADVYRVQGVDVGGKLPDVWLTAGDAGRLERALDAIRACATVRARPLPTAAKRADDQHFVAFIAEAATSDDAAMLASAAVSTRSHEALGVSHGPVCCVLVARSFVVGVRAFERRGALDRFADPVASVLRNAVGRAAT